MLTVDIDRICIGEGSRVLDLGSGNGRHTAVAASRGASLVALDSSEVDLRQLTGLITAMRQSGEIKESSCAEAVAGDAVAIPFQSGSFDAVIASEVLEHIVDDAAALDEITRVVHVGGIVGISVPRAGPEALCWLLSRAYHSKAGGHIRIYRRRDLRRRCERAGLVFVGAEYRHGLHAPYWWLRCALGVDRPERRLVAWYHRFLVWDIVAQPRLTRALDMVLNPVIGKSLVLYFERPLP